jgi:glutaminase
MKKFLVLFACVAAVLWVLPVEALTLPNYATGGNLSESIQSKGKAITDIISMIVAILAIIGMLVGAGKFAVGNGEAGKTWVVGGVVALIIAASVYGIASLVNT